MVVGVTLAFYVRGDLGGVDLTLAGAIAMAAGAVLVIAAILQLRRARRTGGTGLRGRAAQGYYKTGKGKIIAMIVAVVYIVSPIDLVPDFLLPIGIVDDASALTWLLFAFGQEYRRRHGQALPPA
ncbi:DUF1232 domain-containing protein [Actinomadura sp. PM05-2]|uniref:DUF1232 domain-containing protein n=2 Tax=Actinomadura parmotrematis TaxID=2864039 RepID=A0ABS7G331_9ACTN|nr:DUF1232 domain-containing protein [Actinomadura parmotrematis]